MLFRHWQKTGLCLFAGYKNPFCGIIVAFQSAKETGFKPIISHMEGATGLAGWGGKRGAGWVPNPGGDSEWNSSLLIKNLIPRLLLVISV